MGVELPLRVVVTILECCVTFSGVKLSIRSFVLLLLLLIGFYREFFQGHIAELSGALACLALLCIDQLSLKMSNSFQYIIVNVL